MSNFTLVVVALNLQTPGSKMDCNIGKFQQNGGCGYVLKPSVMRSGEYTTHSGVFALLGAASSFTNAFFLTL